MTCKDCIHHKVCMIKSLPSGFIEDVEVNCPDFKDKSRLIEWHKITTRPLTDDEREFYDEEICFIYDCEMPEDGEEILIATKFGVSVDTCVRDDYAVFLDRYDDFDGVFAWAYIPKYEEAEKALKEREMV